MAFRFSITRAVCCATPPSTIWLVAGSNAICPAVKINPPAFTACEYGPIALGALSVEIISFTVPPGNFKSRFAQLGAFAHGMTLIAQPKILGDAFSVEPQAEHRREIAAARPLERRTQVRIAGLAPALGGEHIRDARVHRPFAAHVLQRDEE